MFWYLATPFTDYPGGHEAAFTMACEAAAAIADYGISIFSPIAHGYPLAKWGGLKMVDHDFWMKFDLPFMHAAAGMYVWKEDGWNKSKGVLQEIEYFRQHAKPISYLNPSEILQKKIKSL